MTPILRRVTLTVEKNQYLRMQISWSSHRIRISLGVSISKLDQRGRPPWDGMRVRKNTFHGPRKIPAATINAIITAFERRVDEAFLNFELTDSIPTPQQLKAILKDKPLKSDKNRISTLFLDFLRDGEKTRQWSENTTRSVRNVGNLINKYLPDATLEDLTPDTIPNFISYQVNHRLSSDNIPAGQPGYSNSSALKNAGILRWFLKWATYKGLIPEKQWKPLRIDVKRIRRPVIYLTWEELTRLEKLPLEPSSELDRARDFFIFCCFSSLRYSDAAALRKSDIRQNRFAVTTQKTSTNILIDLNDHSRAILEKYRDTDSPYALPRITNNRLNHLLKELGRIAGIDTPVRISQYYGPQRIDRTLPKHELLTTHCGRRTFICQALMLGIPPQVVMKWTGHADYAAMRPYIEIADQTKADAMTLFNR